MNTPLWILGENGAETTEDINDTMSGFTVEEFPPLCEQVDKKTLRQIKWKFLITAIKFFFSR